MARNRSAICVFKTEFFTHLSPSLASGILLGHERTTFVRLQGGTAGRHATNHNAVAQKERASAGDGPPRLKLGMQDRRLQGVRTQTKSELP